MIANATLMLLVLAVLLLSADAFCKQKALRFHVDDLIARMRNLALDLRSSILDDLGLVPALRGLFERFRSQTGVRVEFMQSSLGDRRFGAEVETAAYRIIQEALTNVARHARVGHVTVLIWATSASLGVEIEDRGVGFDPARPTARSLGLAGMRDRARRLGGRLVVDTSRGAGTLITAVLPLRGKHRSGRPGPLDGNTSR